ncbi:MULTISPECIES: ATP-grasp fold amidoligase family protein [Clostridium]|uniref:ATP-grasp fold amidoligase family protein n=1 Tax=Clostridium TaxID=1485 RepID=UPI00290E3C16|nr:ATP-grasp fold amidoligase family protein [Clostridium sp.]
MKNSELIYLIRRKLQVLAYRITSPELMSKIYFRIVLKQKLNLITPRTFNEKIQLYKLRYCPNNKTVITCSDKYRIREYLEEKKLTAYAVPCVGFWENVDDIPWNELLKRFVLKCNHGCAYNIICKDKDSLDIEKSKKLLKKWMKEDFGEFNAEPHYSKIKRGVICEEYLGDGVSDFLIDYKIHCFSGNPRFVLICSGRAQHSAEYKYYDMEWNELQYSTTGSSSFEMPKSFELMRKISEIVAKDFPFVRVDFYEVNGKPYIGELTFVPAGGLDNTLPPAADIEIGKLFDISNLEVL